MKKMLSLFFIIACLIFVQCKNETPTTQSEEGGQLGNITISYSGSEEAMPHFKKGLLLLHNFEYDDARKSFLKAQELDSTMAMAYWGESMTYNHPLWREQEYENGQEALNKLAASPEERQSLALTELEKDFLQAVEILYGEGEKKERDVAYSNHLETLYKKHPGNEEVAAFYALSCLGAVPLGRDKAAYEKGAAVAQGIIDENPRHPGALHYLIHAYDDPGHAVMALEAANSYSEVAADATHALHMPSHIYVAVGMWDEVINSNIASWEASVKKMETEELGPHKRSYHALHWLMYGHLQKGQYQIAEQIMKTMDEYTQPDSKKGMRSYFVRMKANYLMETENWENPIAHYDTEKKDLSLTNRAAFHFLEGVKAFHQDDIDKLSSIIQELGQERVFAETIVTEGGLAMCQSGGANRYKPNQVDIDHTQVMELELKALRKWKEAEAEIWLKKATELEEEISYSFGPPIIAKPSFELYGDWLLDQKRGEDAVLQFEKALNRGPRRLNSLQGLWKAQELAGMKEKAAATKSTIDELLQEADTSLEDMIIWGTSI